MNKSKSHYDSRYIILALSSLGLVPMGSVDVSNVMKKHVFF